MAENSKIAWCDHTHNIVIGCFKVQPGCENCYAEILANHRFQDVEWKKGGNRRVLKDAYWNKLKVYNDKAREAHQIHRVFVGSLCDWLEDHPTVDEQRDRLFLAMGKYPHLLFMLLTKRIERFYKVWPDPRAVKFKNVIIGISAGTQDTYDRNAPILEAIKTQYGLPTFISMEPMLEPIDLRKKEIILPDQIIIGGESGPKARPFGIDWATSIVNHTHRGNTSIFIKQMGTAWAKDRRLPMRSWVGEGYSTPYSQGDRKGENPDYWPIHLRKFEHPKVYP